MEKTGVFPPSSLFILWPGDEPPMPEEIRMRLAEWGQAAPELGSEGPEETLWSFWFELAEKPVSFFVWCEPMGDGHKMLLDNVHWRNSRQREEAYSSRWMVGMEGQISLGEPTADYQLQLRLCEAISREWSPVVFDASALLFRSVDDVRLLTETRTPPRKSCLYTIHKVLVPDDQSPVARYWIHTHGLERAGIPDLEIFDVEEPLLGSACELVDTVVDLWIEFGVPDAEVAFAIGGGLEIAWRPWQAFASLIPGENVGGWSYRRPEQGHGGSRAVLVPKESIGQRSRTASPLDVLRRITRSETTLYKTVQESRRMAKLARERWGTFGILFASHRRSDWRFAVKLSFAMQDDPRHGEHLWFDVMEIRPGKILGRLISVPAHLPKATVPTTGWQDLDRLSDWRIVTPMGIFDPETAGVLLEERLSLAGV